ncbi:hypothetical protein WK13_33455 [Burkholderia ubonensis]|nr:hypothetical protein WK13_33455 [Burkholderia ubonensis]
MGAHLAWADFSDGPQDGLMRSRPEAQGIDSARILAFIDEAAQSGFEMQSFMLARGGHVVAEGWWEPYRADRIHAMHSLTKSVTACAVGIAMAEGHFQLSDRVTSFFKDRLPQQVSENLSLMTIEDLLTMRTGHATFVSGAEWRPIKTSWIDEFFKIPVVYKPGTKFVYTSAATFMLSAIITRTTGQSTADYLRPRLFQPLNITGYRWDAGPEGITPGANGLSWKTSDSLKLAMLQVQEGMWQGKRILPAEWVKAVQAQHVPHKYGYQWWLGPQGAFYADGMFYQLAIAFPEQDAALAITAGIPRRSGFDKLVFKHFPAAFSGTSSGSGIMDAKLTQRCRSLHLLPPPKVTWSPAVDGVSGKTFRFAANDDNITTIRLDFAATECAFVLTDDRGTHTIRAGFDRTIEGTTTMTGHKLHHEYQPNEMRVSASGAWLDDRTFMMTWSFVETAFRDTVVCRFNGPYLRFDRSVNVNYASTERPTITGTMEGSEWLA